MPAAGFALLLAAACRGLTFKEPHPHGHAAPRAARVSSSAESRAEEAVGTRVPDGRDLTRAQDTARLSRDEAAMKTAAAELPKLRAEREALKKREAFILSREEKAKKDTIEDMHLIIDRLQGQVKAQEREISRQENIINGLQEDLKREGTALLDGRDTVRPAPTDESLIKGLERDVATQGTTLLHSDDADPRASLRRTLGAEVRALAKHAAQLEKFLAENGEGPAQPLARAVAAEAEHLDRSIGNPRTQRTARAPQPARAPPAPEADPITALPAAPIDESVPEVKDDLTPLSDSLPQPLTEELPPLKDAELSPQAFNAPAPPAPPAPPAAPAPPAPRHRAHMQRLRKIQADRPAVAKVEAGANRTRSAQTSLPVPTSTPSMADATDGATAMADVPDALDAPDAPDGAPDTGALAAASDPGPADAEALPVEAASDVVAADPSLADALDEDSE